MESAITPALLNGIGVVGVVVFVGWMIATGRLVTRREHEAVVKRAETAESERAELIEQKGALMEWARVGKSTFTVLRERAE